MFYTNTYPTSNDVRAYLSLCTIDLEIGASDYPIRHDVKINAGKLEAL